jgi:hypothetical protein
VANLESSRDGTHPPLGRGSLGRHAAHALGHFSRRLQRSKWLWRSVDLRTTLPAQSRRHSQIGEVVRFASGN